MSAYPAGPRLPLFDGVSTPSERKADEARLTKQTEYVRHIMSDGGWHTLAGLAESIKRRFGVMAGEASISARIREFEHEKRRVQGPGLRGQWEYRMVQR